MFSICVLMEKSTLSKDKLLDKIPNELVQNVTCLLSVIYGDGPNQYFRSIYDQYQYENAFGQYSVLRSIFTVLKLKEIYEYKKLKKRNRQLQINTRKLYFTILKEIQVADERIAVLENEIYELRNNNNVERTENAECSSPIALKRNKRKTGQMHEYNNQERRFEFSTDECTIAAFGIDYKINGTKQKIAERDVIAKWKGKKMPEDTSKVRSIAIKYCGSVSNSKQCDTLTVRQRNKSAHSINLPETSRSICQDGSAFDMNVSGISTSAQRDRFASNMNEQESLKSEYQDRFELNVNRRETSTSRQGSRSPRRTSRCKIFKLGERNRSALSANQRETFRSRQQSRSTCGMSGRKEFISRQQDRFTRRISRQQSFLSVQRNRSIYRRDQHRMFKSSQRDGYGQ